MVVRYLLLLFKQTAHKDEYIQNQRSCSCLNYYFYSHQRILPAETSHHANATEWKKNMVGERPGEKEDASDLTLAR